MSSIIYVSTSDERLRNELVTTLGEAKLVFVSDAAELFELTYEPQDLVILHLQSIDENVELFIEYLFKDIAGIKIFALTDKPDLIEGTKMVQKGIKGYGSSVMHPVILDQAISVIQSGNIWLYPELALFIISQAEVKDDIHSRIESFTAREQEIILLVCQGNSNKKIAQMLNLSEISIKKALTQIYQQLGVHDRMEMVAKLR